jgi:PhoD-like phosphatase
VTTSRLLTRRALLAATGAAIAGGIAATTRLWPSGAERQAQGPTAWGESWTSPLWQRLSVHGSTRGVVLPEGWRQTAPDQPIPVFLHDRELRTGDLELGFRVTTPTLRAGVLFGARAPFTFAGVTLEENALVLAQYGREDRRVLAKAAAAAPESGREYRLRVEIEDGEMRAVCWPADADRPDWQLTAPHRAVPGGPGVLVVQPVDRATAELEVVAFEVRSAAGFAETSPANPIVLTGTPTPAGEDGYSALVSVWSAWPADITFERSVSADVAVSERFKTVSVTSPPYVAHARIETAAGGRTFWRARLRSRTSARETVTRVHELRPPEPGRPLTLLAASCIQHVGVPPNRGFARLLQAAPEAPALLVFQGDLGYAGNVANAAYAPAPDFFADRFRRALARPDFALLREKVPVAFTLDDHDYGPPNNANRTSVRSWAVRLWNSIHADPSTRGYFETRFGDVHCLMLDVRRYADPPRRPDTAEKTRLGREQYAWLAQTLRESDAGLFVVFSAGTFARRWDPDSQQPVLDTFIHGWPDEYRRVMELFGEIQAAGRRVVIMSGDAHGLRIHRHPDPMSGLAQMAGEIVEFVCSGLRTALWSTAPPDDPTVDRERAVTGRAGAGMVVVEPADAAERRITLRAIGADDGRDAFPPLVLPFGPK